ncbi:hypothetical protein CUZ56_01208 [Saezia sanguinis]|uniref:Nucleotidyltransferase n=2 Tax=Saezia sanguinis TaxID=1965230 RepID=A0A433SEV9_9BURK|nr:hypothetical protein CUZ56_01208 [Saezia sanguinis]
MHYEPIASSQRPSIPIHSSARLFYLMDAIAQAHEPTMSQLAELERSYNSTGEFLSTCPEFKDNLIQIHAHGSRQLGTIIRPWDDTRQGFDIDLIARLNANARLKYNGEQGPAILLEHLYRALFQYAQRCQLRLLRWERCMTLEYAGGMCADIAPVIDSPLLAAPYGDTHGLIPDRALLRFVSTNPRGYAQFFETAAQISPNFTAGVQFAEAMDSMAKAEVEPLPDADEVLSRILCRFVQLIKLHRNIAFGPAQRKADAAPTSVFLTTLAAMAYIQEAPRPHESPLELLLDIAQRMPGCFERTRLPDGSEEWKLPNPAAPQSNLAEGMNSPVQQQAFWQWHHKLINDLDAILSAIENHSGMDVLLKALGSAFGPRSVNAVQQSLVGQKQLIRNAGKTSFVPSFAAIPATVASRPHTFFGEGHGM